MGDAVMISGLRACPFCGEPRELRTTKDGPWARISCKTCDAEGPVEDTEAKAVAAWNRREAPK
jgi:Lar family restriction alleviation protein